MRGAGGEDGQKAALDISADHSGGGCASHAGQSITASILTDDQLNSLDVGNLLLGGRLLRRKKVYPVEVRADTVEVADNVALTHDEICWRRLR